MLMVSTATLERWSAAVTRSLTWWLAGVGKLALVTAPAALKGPNGPLSATSHAYSTIGLVRSLEVETSEISWPGCGELGNQTNEASG